MILIKLLGWAAVIAAWVFIDWYQIVKLKRSINHGVELVIRGMVGILYGAIVFDAQPGFHGVWVISFEASSFYLLFEIGLNLARGLAWDYIGTSSAMDRFLYHRPAVVFLMKLASLVAVILSAYKLVQYGRF